MTPEPCWFSSTTTTTRSGRPATAFGTSGECLTLLGVVGATGATIRGLSGAPPATLGGRPTDVQAEARLAATWRRRK
jgi:hypothetical protein